MSPRWGRFRVVVVVAVGMAGTALSSPAAAQELVVNGSFETPVLGAGAYEVMGGLPGWTSSFGAGIELQHNPVNVGPAFDGAQDVELDSFTNSGMQQVLPTISGQSYALSFEYSPRPGYPATTNGIEVRLNGALVMTVAKEGVGLSTTQWTRQDLSFRATGSTTLELRASGTPDALGGLLDVVSVVPTASPASVPALPPWASGLAVVLLGGAGARSARRDRQRRRDAP